MLDGFFDALPAPEAGVVVRGIIAPHAGFEYSGRCAARAYRRLSPAQGIRRVILMGPSHRYGFSGACVADYTALATPLGRVPVDTGICRALAGKKLFKSDRDTMRYEHSLENQLPFLQKALGEGGLQDRAHRFRGAGQKGFRGRGGDHRPLHRRAHPGGGLQRPDPLRREGFSYTPFRRDLRRQPDQAGQGIHRPVRRLDFDRSYAYHEKTGITACGFVPSE